MLMFLNIYTIGGSSEMYIKTKEINTITFMDSPSIMQFTRTITFIDNPSTNFKIAFEIIKKYYIPSLIK